MSVAELLPAIQALPLAERLRLARDIISSTIDSGDAEFPVKATADLLTLADVAKSDVRVHARDHATDTARFEALAELTQLSQELKRVALDAPLR